MRARATDVLPLIQDIERVGVRGHEATSRNEIIESRNCVTRSLGMYLSSKKHQNAVGFLGSSSANRGNTREEHNLVRSSPKITGSSTLEERKAGFDQIGLWDVTRKVVFPQEEGKGELRKVTRGDPFRMSC